MSTPPVKFPKPNRNSGKPPIRKGDGNGPTPGPNGDKNWVTPGLVFLTIVAICLFSWVALHPNVMQQDMTQAKLFELIHEGKVEKIVNEPDPSTGLRMLTGTYKSPTPSDPNAVTSFKVPVDLSLNPWLAWQIKDAGYTKTIETEANTNWFLPMLFQLLPILFVFGLLYFLFRQQIRMAGKSAFSFGKSKARMMTRDRNKVTFKDVAGIDEAREELSEIVEFLKDPRRFQRLGGRIPKGVLMIGPPGTGKTLLAKAIAGEADVPFFSISGSDFVEMFVGVGASRVRDMFEQGKKNAPCLIFIDEIDAVGRSRGTGMGGGHDEREQTLNALLVEMDGIETAEGVIIIAATNRKDVLDPALLRPGRFDREVRVNLPDVRGREQILHVHTRNVKVAKTVDLGLIARGTPGYSGAESGQRGE